MALTADTQPTAPPKYAAAYLIATDVAEGVAALLVIGGYRVTAAVVNGPGQIPRYLVQSADPHAAGRDAGLTDREMEVLARIARGQSNPDIGRDMYLAVDTVKTHVRRLFRKLNVGDRAEAVAVAYQRGILGQAAA
ncbi:response regulator transcription factor [Amycolatopsis sp. NPDC004378]